ncbi:MAG: DUF1810 family protein [Anaerolineales bacterium]
MTLFAGIAERTSAFQQVIEKYYQVKFCQQTLKFLERKY